MNTFASVLDVPRAKVRVVVGQRGLHVVQAQPKPRELRWIRAHKVLLWHPAPRIHVSDARYRPQQRFDRVFLNVREVDQCCGVGGSRVRVTLNQVLEDFAHRRGGRAEHRLSARRKLRHGILHPLLDLSSRKIQLHIVVECDGYDGESDLRDGPHAPRSRKAEHGHFHRIGDLLLDLDRRQPSRRRHHDDLIRREIRKCIRRDRRERPCTHDCGQQRCDDHDSSVPD